MFVEARLGWLVVLIAALAGSCLGQNTSSGDICGTVTDASVAVVPGVGVTLLNTDTGVATQLVTNSAGLYDAVSILPGKYSVTFVKEGFRKVVRDGITVGGTQQQIEVTGEPPLLQTETAEQSTTLQSQAMEGLPDIGQNWQNFVKLLPGSAGTPASNSGAANPGVAMSINGNLPYYSSFMADGASIRLPHSANVDKQVQETVSEVQINTSSFAAQYGGGGTIFNVISKSGSNQWHGNGYEYFQNDALNARSFFDGLHPARQRYDNFGGSVAGPVIRKKAFFYFNLDKIVNPKATTTTRLSLRMLLNRASSIRRFSGLYEIQAMGCRFRVTRFPRADGTQLRQPFRVTIRQRTFPVL